jgi:GAF domain-containing protein
MPIDGTASRLKSPEQGASRHVTTMLDDRQAALERENAELRQQLDVCTAELKEAHEQQTATSEVLQVINSSPGGLAPVFDAMLEKALRLCDAALGVLFTREGELFRAAATLGLPAPLEDFLRNPFKPDQMPLIAGVIQQGQVLHVHDAADTDGYQQRLASRVAGVELGGVRTVLYVPLTKDGRVLGVFVIFRQKVRPFSDKQIALVQNFAAQAVIAMENARLITETREALEQQTATAEVLQVINSSPGDLAPVFGAILEKARSLCGAVHAALVTYDGEHFRAVATYGIPEPLDGLLRTPFRPEPGGPHALLLGGQRLIHIADQAAVGEPGPASPRWRASVDAGARTLLWVPLRKDGALLGCITASRWEVQPFSDKEIALLENFAAQAVIAMENARLITETREALEQQTATAEVLQVINSSPGDLVRVFDAMLQKAIGLCDAAHGHFLTYDGDAFHPAAVQGEARFAEYWRQQGSFRPSEGNPLWRLVHGERIVHLADAREDAAYRDVPVYRRIIDIGGIRTSLTVPLCKDGVLLGAVIVYRRELRPFTGRQVALLENFAAQAVIAMENARLLTETREALEQQTATAEVLQVINTSPGDLAPVFDAILDKAHSLCDVAHGSLQLYDGVSLRAVATHGVSDAFADILRQGYRAADSPASRGLIEGRRFVQIADCAEIDHPVFQSAAEFAGIRTVLFVPLRRDDALLGLISSARREVRPFSDNEIALLQNFAAQAVIAMQNARLLTETREALDQQTATAEVLQVINSSPGALRPVFDAILEKAHALCEASFGALMTYDGERFQPVAQHGVPASFKEVIEEGILPQPGDPFGLMAEGAPLSHIHDLAEVAAQYPDNPLPRAAVDLGGIRTLLVVPLRKDDALLGVITAYRQEVRPFSDRQIALLQNFAAQAVIAIENARLLGEIRMARDSAEAALRELNAAQASLIHAEKMASLGQLTAGIAHEIKNPLNFVNNFAGLSVELLDELKETARPALDALGGDKRTEIDEVVAMLTGNLDKIAEHGRRADGIVKSMLDHSRGEVGERRPIDLNHLVEEALSLAHHGARAQDQSFNIALERDFAPGMAPIAVVPQDITRVCLNLFGNGFYAASKRHQADGGASVKVTTRELGQAVEIRVRDNGTGIAPELRDKLFQPFFTTKPTGEGTGLGLSICWDIVTQQHGGTITVDSSLGEFTEFTVRLPRRAATGPGPVVAMDGVPDGVA